mgnify:CR=1 FL=1
MRKSLWVAWDVVQFCLAVAFFVAIGFLCTRGALKVHDNAAAEIAREVEAEEAIRFTESRDSEYREWQGMQVDFVAGK